MQWTNFLHIYQPANSDGHVIKEATEMSYMRLVRALEEHPQIKFTMNITGCLFLRWEEMGYQDLIKRIARLIKKGQIDLTGTAAYHPIIPLIPEKEAISQIKENEVILKKHLGATFKPRGFFFPEMAYSPESAKIVKSLGYEWMILDEIANNGKIGKTDFDRIYRDENSGLLIVLRSRKYSNSYVPVTVLKLLDKNIEQEKKGLKPTEENIVTATDGELYGLRYIDHTGEFEKLLKRKDIKTATVSEFIDARKENITDIKPSAHSWESSEAELEKNDPFNLWQEKNNTVQKKLWQLANLAIETIEENKTDNNYHWARWHLVRGLASCTFWWASARDFQKMFGPISWNPDQIERGTNELVRAIRALEDVETREAKVKAEKLFIAIKKMIWERHWVYYWKKT